MKAKLLKTAAHKTLLVFSIFVSFWMVYFQAANPQVIAAPMPDTEITALKNYAHWVADKCAVDAAGGAITDPGAANADGSIYLLGDSILEGMYYENTFLKKDLEAKSWKPYADASMGRAIQTPGSDPGNNRPGHEQSAVTALKTDASQWELSSTIVLELGTNSSGSAKTFRKQYNDLIDTIQAKNKDANIYLVEIFSQVPQKSSYNKEIKDLVKDKKLKGSIDTSALKISDVHPDTAGYKKLSGIIVDALGSSGSTTTGSASTKPDYVKAGNIPIAGETVGATTYGGVYRNGKWGPSNNVQGGSQPYDDNGRNSYDGKPIAGQTAFAELGMGELLGHLPYKKDGKPNTKLEITYKNKSIIAEKVDIGTGQAGNSHYKVDLWWETAKLLGVTDNADIKIHAVPNDTPVTPLDGSPSAASSTADSTVSAACSCPADGSGSASSGGDGPTIVIDPGHSGGNISETDKKTGLYDFDYSNNYETEEVFTVSQKVQKKLQSDGYKVIMTKNKASDKVLFRDRANIANKANADLALSIHNNHDTSWQNMGGGLGGQVYVQDTDLYRVNKPGMGRGQNKVYFKDEAVAKKSKQYGNVFASERTKAEDHKVGVTSVNFDSRSDLPSGNIPEVMLFSTVPWVYNEVGAPSGPLNSGELDKYAKGIINSVEKAVPSTGAGSPKPATSGTSSGSACCDSASGTVGGDPSTAGTTTLTGKDNRAKIFNFFVGKGLKDFQAAGIVGNLEQESNLDPTTPGGGLAQWIGGRQTALQNFAKQKHKNVNDLSVQLDYLWAELTNGKGASGDYSHVLKSVKATTNIHDATEQFQGTASIGGNINGFENPGIPMFENRLKFANITLDQLGSGKSGGSTGSSSTSSDCSGSTRAGSPNCTSAVGNAKILCEARKYDNASYEESAAGNHGTGSAQWKKTCKFDRNGDATPSCKLDCSGLVSVAVYDAFGYDAKPPWVTFTIVTDKANWKKISFSQARPGDVIEPNPGHVEIIDHISGNHVITFGAHTSNYPQPKQVGPSQMENNAQATYFRYVGKGAN